ncbi:hypothetical protein BaRGS_00007737 [Batillaria attramentaria]|uniref:Uncharacterized protein n=1 Tax=Batillaria attramentaria TaxID=370345 RepID=A0ABD0LNF2_9CAEN
MFSHLLQGQRVGGCFGVLTRFGESNIVQPPVVGAEGAEGWWVFWSFNGLWRERDMFSHLLQGQRVGGCFGVLTGFGERERHVQPPVVGAEGWWVFWSFNALWREKHVQPPVAGAEGWWVFWSFNGLWRERDMFSHLL